MPDALRLAGVKPTPCAPQRETATFGSAGQLHSISSTWNTLQCAAKRCDAIGADPGRALSRMALRSIWMMTSRPDPDLGGRTHGSADPGGRRARAVAAPQSRAPDHRRHLKTGDMISATAATSSATSPAWLEILQVVPSLLWPALIFGVALLFRKEIKAKIPGLTSVKTLPFEATFADQLKDLAQHGATASGSDRRDVIGRALRAKSYCAGKRILWVDDNPGNNRALGQFLTELIDVQIDYALSTAEAMEILRRRGDYSMVITDMARGVDRNAGIDLIREMHKENLSIPTVIYGSKDSSTEGVPPGAFGLTNRPDLLLHYIVDICEREAGGQLNRQNG